MKIMSDQNQQNMPGEKNLARNMVELALLVEEFPPSGEFSDFIFCLLKNFHLHERAPGSWFLVCEISCDPCCQTIWSRFKITFMTLLAQQVDNDDLENKNLKNGKS